MRIRVIVDLACSIALYSIQNPGFLGVKLGCCTNANAVWPDVSKLSGDYRSSHCRTGATEFLLSKYSKSLLRAWTARATKSSRFITLHFTGR